MKHTTLPRWGQWISGLTLMSLAITAGGLSLYFNVSSGLALGIGIAVAFGLSDVAKIILPIVCTAIGWTKHLRLAYRAATVVSVLCAIFYLSDQFGADLISKERANQSYVNADKRIGELEGRLSDAQSMVVAEAAKGGCGPRCEALKADVNRIDAALNSVRAGRARIEPEKLDGKTTVFAWATGLSPKSTGRAIILILIACALLMGELICHTSAKAAEMIGQAMARPEPIEQPKPTKKKPAQRKSRAAAKKVPTAKQKAAKTFDRAFGAYSKGKIDGRTTEGRSIKKAANINVGEPANTNA